MWSSMTQPGSSPVLHKVDAHSAHSEHDERRDKTSDQRTADHDPVGDQFASSVREKHESQSRRQMG